MNTEPYAWLILKANFIATLWMTAVVLFVFNVHYPMFRLLDRKHFAAAMKFHQKRTGPIVMPAMLIEVITSLSLLIVRPVAMPLWAALGGVLCMAVSGWVTVLWSVPRHTELLLGYNQNQLASLQRSNQYRSLAWILHTMLLAYFLFI